jgi:hypothetical protein
LATPPYHTEGEGAATLRSSSQQLLGHPHRFGFSVTVCHYPSGASKWNPIEHRMFSEISKNWAGRPLESFETVLKYIRTTQTATGLRVGATFNPRDYPTGVQIDDHVLAMINLARHDVLPDWNYTLCPTSQKLRSYS